MTYFLGNFRYIYPIILYPCPHFLAICHISKHLWPESNFFLITSQHFPDGFNRKITIINVAVYLQTASYDPDPLSDRQRAAVYIFIRSL